MLNSVNVLPFPFQSIQGGMGLGNPLHGAVHRRIHAVSDRLSAERGANNDEAEPQLAHAYGKSRQFPSQPSRHHRPSCRSDVHRGYPDKLPDVVSRERRGCDESEENSSKLYKRLVCDRHYGRGAV